MRKLLILIAFLLCINSCAKAEDKVQPATPPPQQEASKTFISDTEDLEQIYRESEVPTFKYVHDVDPGESFETQQSTWSPYPLLKLASPIYFKTVIIQPGYYLLTPREQDGGWYMLFKEAGKVRYIVPIYKKEMVSMDFYKENIPKPKMTISQKMHLGMLNFVGNHVKSSQRKPEAQNYLEVSDLNDNFVSIVLYWGNYKYYIVVRTIQL